MSIRRMKGFKSVSRLESQTANLDTLTLTASFEANTIWKKNLKCDMFVRYISGRAYVEIENKGLFLLSARRMQYLLIPHGIPYRFIIKKGEKITFDVFCTPPWEPEQNKRFWPTSDST